MSEDPEFEIQFYESVHKRIPDDLRVIELLGGLYTSVGRIEAGLEMDRKAVALDPKGESSWYNLACSLALSNELDEALQALSRAVSLGYDDVDWMEKDKDLEALRGMREYWMIVDRLKRQGA